MNGHTEEFVLASSASLDNDQAWFPDDCVYDKYADSSDPAPVAGPEPNHWDPILDFYAAVMLDNGMLLLSFEGKAPIPTGNYWINVHTTQQEEGRGNSRCLNCNGSPLRIGSIYPISFVYESVVDYKVREALQEEEEAQTFKCQVLDDHPNRLYCYGSPLNVGAEYQINFVRERPIDYNVQEKLTTDYFELRSTSLPPFDFSRISGAALDLGMNEVNTIGQAWNVVGACIQTYLGGAQLPESCQWFVAYALGLGTNGFEDPFFFDDPIIAFEDPFFFDDPIIAFEDPFFFDDPIIAFDDPIIAFDDPIIAFEDPFFFDDPIIAFEDPFFFDDPIIAFDDSIIAFEDPFFLKNLTNVQTGWVSGITQSSNRGLGFNCGQTLNIPYSNSLGTYTDQVYASALAQRQQGNSLPNACETLIVQCTLTPGNGCFISPGTMGWTWPEGGEPSTTGFDCTGENADRFYCQQVKYPKTDLYVAGQTCGKELKWGTHLRTHGQYADLMFYLASVTPWLTRESLPQTCVDFVMQGAHSLHGISPLAIWGSNGTSLTAFGLPLIMTMPEPSTGAALKPVVPGSDSNSCLPNGTPCNSCDVYSCHIQDCKCVPIN